MNKMQLPSWLNETLNEEFDNILEGVESDYDTTGNLSEICHESYDGFIPFTNGGIDFMASLRLSDCEGSGTFPNNEKVTAELERAVSYGYEQAREAFIAANYNELKKTFVVAYLDNNSDRVNYHTLYEMGRGSLAETLSEFEMEYNDDTFFIQHRAMFYSEDNSRNITGEDEIYFYSGVNTDYEYGRDKGLMDCYEETVKVSDLTPNKVKEIVKKMLHSA